MTGASGASSVTTAQLVAVTVFIGMSGLVIVTAELLRRAFLELDAAAKQQAAMNAELRHRVKNSLAVVQALAAQTGRTALDFESLYDDFRGRLLALAAAHDLLSSGGWTTCDLSLLAHEALKPFASKRIRIDGQPARIADLHHAKAPVWLGLSGRSFDPPLQLPGPWHRDRPGVCRGAAQDDRGQGGAFD
jgi:hypothetical protein